LQKEVEMIAQKTIVVQSKAEAALIAVHQPEKRLPILAGQERAVDADPKQTSVQR
jgi:hypothetical protein